jgi:hypothetical protein
VRDTSPTTRTAGALAIATTPAPVPAAVPSDDITPEEGFSFRPDEPELAPVVSAPTPPPPPRQPSGAAPVAPGRPTVRDGSGGAAAPAAPVAPPVAEPLAGPLAEPISSAALARESLAELVHTRPGRTDSAGAHRASGSTRPPRSMFGAGDEEHAASSRGGGSGLMLKLAGAGGVLLVLGAVAWVIFGGGGGGAEKGTPRRASAQAASAAPRPATSKPASPAPSQPAAPDPSRTASRTPAGSEILPASLAGAAAAAEEAGSLQLDAPFALDVFEDGVRLGTTASPIVLGAGRHVLELVSTEYAFRGRQVVEIRPGRSSKVAARLPNGRAHVNAIPWAEVWIDGVRAGETPLGNLELTIGPHEATFRHPQLGEQTRTLIVTAGEATRLSVEMKR